MSAKIRKSGGAVSLFTCMHTVEYDAVVFCCVGVVLLVACVNNSLAHDVMLGVKLMHTFIYFLKNNIGTG